MIFVGPNFSDPNSHFVTNVIDSIGSNEDLILDVLKTEEKNEIFSRIRGHLVDHKEKYIIYNAKEDEDFFLSVKREFPELKLVVFFSDDEWRHSNYDRYLALFSDCFTIAVKGNLDKYKSYGLENVFYMRWGCNPDKFYPVAHNKKYDVTFVGAAYGKRIEYVRYLVANKVNIRVFGRGWSSCKDLLPIFGGCPSNNEMLDIVGQSKINLNFIWTSRHPDETTIKGRTLELAACNAFQLSNYTEEFNNYGFVDRENIAVFKSRLSLLKKINYYLGHVEEREKIATSCYKHVITSLTWKQQFNNLFEFMREENVSSLTKYSVLVINKRNVTHKISPVDERLDIKIDDGSSSINYAEYDGVIELFNNSSIDNNAIYMMVFGLSVDSSGMIFANIFVESKLGLRWIRFEQKHLSSHFLCWLLPKDVIMFSGEQFSKEPKLRKRTHNISYVEYPVCVVETSYFRNRLLRLNYGYFRGFREKFVVYLKNWQFIELSGLVVDKLWQRAIKTR